MDDWTSINNCCFKNKLSCRTGTAQRFTLLNILTYSHLNINEIRITNYLNTPNYGISFV